MFFLGGEWSKFHSTPPNGVVTGGTLLSDLVSLIPVGHNFANRGSEVFRSDADDVHRPLVHSGWIDDDETLNGFEMVLEMQNLIIGSTWHIYVYMNLVVFYLVSILNGYSRFFQVTLLGVLSDLFRG